MSMYRSNEDTVDFKQARLESQFEVLTEELKTQAGIGSRLLQRLQTTLESSEMAGIFAREIKEWISYDQLIFTDHQGAVHSFGDRATKHSCDYNLILDEDQIGAIKFHRNKRFSERELTIIEQFLGILIYPLRNAKRYQMALDAAMSDPLTNCGNKRALESALRREAELAKRQNQSLSVIIFDIDHFKSINDSLGHAAGDYVLSQLSTEVSGLLRQTDQLFRFGGEEFVILLHNTDIAIATKVAERLRKAIEISGFVYQQHSIDITASFGVGQYLPGEQLQSLIERTDKALYQAKENGRNQVQVGEIRSPAREDDIQHYSRRA